MRDEGTSPVASPSTVALRVGRVEPFELCTGTLIAENVVLTARHCVVTTPDPAITCNEKGHSTTGAQITGDELPSSVFVYAGTAPRFDASPAAFGHTIVEPNGTELCDSDIALIVLDRKIPGITPSAVRLEGSVAVGEKIRAVGYGENDKSLPLGTRLARNDVAVLAMGSGMTPSHTALGPHEFEVGESICEGDSGGPAYSEETGAIVGVVSRGGGCADDFGHIYTTTSGWNELFTKAFAFAGGAPVAETGHLTAAPPVTSPLPPAPPVGGGCATVTSREGRGGPLLVLLFGLFAIRRKRRSADG